jgi:hypothetical protein
VSLVPTPSSATPVVPTPGSAKELTPESLDATPTDSVFAATPESARELRPDVSGGHPLKPNVTTAGEE